MRFTQIAGHQQLKAKLIETIRQDRVSHSQLFFGPEGNGALPLALAYAQYLLCSNRGELDSCGQCTNCRQIESFNYPDLHFVFPVAKTSSSSSKPISDDLLNQWKSMISEEEYFGLFRWLEFLGIENKQAQISVQESSSVMKKLQLKSYSGDYKVMIMWMPERMNVAAANKLLKLLEEPPQKTLFLLVGEDPENLINTITSRCQKVYVPKYRQEETIEFLKQAESLNHAEAEVIARLADGNLSQARRLAERADTYRSYATLFSSWVRNCFKADVKHMLDWSEECGRFEREKIKDFLRFCESTFRDSLTIHYGNNDLENQIFKEINFELSKFAPFVHVQNSPKILEALDEAIYDVTRNVNPRIVLADLSFDMARYLRLKA